MPDVRDTTSPPGRARDRLRAKIDKLKAEEAACETTTSACGATTPARITSEAPAPMSSGAAESGSPAASVQPSSSPCPPEWYSIGSSDIAALMGTSPHASAVDVWARLVHGVQQPDAPHLAAGREAERWVLDRWAARRDRSITQRNRTIRSAAEYGLPPLRAQLDAWVFEDGIIVEAKAPTRHTQPWTYHETLPPWHWRDQVIWQIGVAGLTRWADYRGAWIVAEWGYHEGDRREWYVPWDDAARARFAEQLAMASDCWAAWITGDAEGYVYAPEPRTAEETALIARLAYPRITQPVIARATAEEAALMAEAIAAGETAAAAKDVSELARAKLMQAIGDREGFETDTERATWRANKRGVRTLRVSRTGEADE